MPFPDNKIPRSLLLIRLSIFLVMAMWTVDKFLNPAHSAQIFEHFYYIKGVESLAINILGAIEMLILLAFVMGYKKHYSYAAILVFHGVSTLSSFTQYLSPFEGGNLLFFTAWPMLAGCITLYWLREYDTLWCFKQQQA